MSFSTKANDWEVTSICQERIPVFDVETWLFEFRSRQAAYSRKALFYALNSGLSIDPLKISVPEITVPISFSGQAPFVGVGVPFSAINCLQSFSLLDLDKCMGVVTSAGASVMVGYRLLRISAYTVFGPYFQAHPCDGIVSGAEIKAIAAFGVWKVLR